MGTQAPTEPGSSAEEAPSAGRSSTRAQARPGSTRARLCSLGGTGRPVRAPKAGPPPLSAHRAPHGAVTSTGPRQSQQPKRTQPAGTELTKASHARKAAAKAAKVDELVDQARRLVGVPRQAQLGPPDLLMHAVKMTNAEKAVNVQRASRDLGRAWEILVAGWFALYATERVGDPVLLGRRKPTDVVVGNCAIDTKYRCGSGDGKHTKVQAATAEALKDLGYEPVMLVLRTDSIRANIKAYTHHGWRVLEGKAAFDFIAAACDGKRLQDALFHSAGIIPELYGDWA